MTSRKDQLENASKEWKKRIESSDAELYSVSGRMKLDNQENHSVDSPLVISVNDHKEKKAPKPVQLTTKHGKLMLNIITGGFFI